MHARVVLKPEGDDDEVALCDERHLSADLLDHTDGLVAHRLAYLASWLVVERVQVRAANARTYHADDRVGGLDQRGVGHVNYANVTSAEHQCGLHVSPSISCLGVALVEG